MGRSILCLGDSNTYGYDPLSFLGGRYPAHIRWTALLDAAPEWKIFNCGENGREIPHRPRELDEADRLLGQRRPDALAVMLGSNDLLLNMTFSAQDVSARMEGFLRHLLSLPALAQGGAKLLLLAPPPMKRGQWATEERLLTQSAQLAPCYAGLARRLGISFADAGQWDVDLTFDGVHFSEDGHWAFAQNMKAALGALFQETDLPMGVRL